MATVFALALVGAVSGGNQILASHSAAMCSSSNFPYGFLCPNDDTADLANNVKLTPIDGTPGGSTDIDAPQQVGPGATFRYETGYDSYQPSGGTNGRNVYNWVILDIRDALFDYTQGIRLYGTTQGPSNDIQYNDGTAADTPMPAACGGDPNSAAPGCRPGPGSPGDVFNACPLEDFAVGPYSGINNDPPEPTGWVGCGLQGKSIVWMRNQDAGNNHIRYRFKFSLPDYVSTDTVPSDSASKFCLRNHVSLGEDQPAASISASNDMRRIARLGDMRCYFLSPTTLSGSVTSDDEEATGRALPGVQLTFSNCEGGDIKAGASERTNSSGNYDVRAVIGARVCITAPNEYTGPDGTQYVLRNPITQGNGEADGGYLHQVPGMNCRSDGPGNLGNPNFYPACNRSDVQLYDRTADDKYDFVYVPVPIPPPMIKGATPGNGVPVVLGQRIDYTFTVQNNRDGNYSNVNISDNIPLNMKQGLSDVFVDSVQFINSGSPPPGWSSETFFYTGPGADNLCRKDGSVFNIPIGYGYSKNFYTEFSCNVHAATTAAPAHIALEFLEMPAYSTLIIKWHGTVKSDAADIGVYPAGATVDSFCANGSATDFTNPGWLSQCEKPDRSEGLQGVVNYTYASVDNSFTGWSNRVFHPIIGRVAPPVKSVTIGGKGLPECDLDGDGVCEYDPANIKYDNGSYKIEVVPDTTAGPIEYYVLDATNNNYADLGADPLNPVIQSSENNCIPDFQRITCSSTVAWGAIRWPTDNMPHPAHFIINVKFGGNEPIGSRFSNVAKLCWIKYWEDAHGVECLPSNPATVER
ncbi:MAG TPA: carboxypeptidase-like regulatory domain-containing protein, partial [Candidatus Saccharimonadia bacterium]